MKTNMRTVTIALISAAAAACAPETQDSTTPPLAAPRLEQVWRVAGLANPESATASSDGTFLYVTNVNGEAGGRDGNGFIARISLDGQLLERDFATGLNAPKGIMLGGDALYVADIDQLVVVDAATGDIRRRVRVEGARFLNDLTFGSDGSVLIADTDGRRIYSIRTDTPEIWLEHEYLDSVNGLLAEPDRLIVTTMAGRLLAIDYETRAVTLLAEGLGNADGVAPLGDGRYLVSEWPGLMHVVSTAGAHRTILDTRAEQRYLNDFLLIGDVLYQPHWEPSEFTAYRVVPGDGQ